MIDEAKQDLLVQYLLGEFDPTTADKVRAELAHDVELRDLARDLEEAFASLAHTASPMAPPRRTPAANSSGGAQSPGESLLRRLTRRLSG